MDKRKSAGSTSLLSRNVVIDGEVLGEENLHVDGNIKGRIKLSGNLFVGASGLVEADVQAINVVIQGKIVGNVTADQQLEIQPSGKLIGDCTAASIYIREGAVFEGRSIKKRPSSPPNKKPIPTKATGKQAPEANKY